MLRYIEKEKRISTAFDKIPKFQIADGSYAVDDKDEMIDLRWLAVFYAVELVDATSHDARMNSNILKTGNSFQSNQACCASVHLTLTLSFDIGTCLSSSGILNATN